MLCKHYRFPRCLLVGVIALGLILPGCEEEEVFLIYDQDEIKRYINEAADEPDLFRIEGLIADTPYRLPSDTAIYCDLVDSVVRTIDVEIAGPFDFDFFGNTYEALATVVDRFYVRTQRTLGTDTIYLSNERVLTRYGYFLLVGDENDPFIGWKLWGYNSLGKFNAPVDLSVTTLDGKNSLPSNLVAYTHQPVAFDTIPYIRLIEIDTLQDNDTLVFVVSPRGDNPLGYYHLVSAEGDAGFFTQAMTRIDSLNWVDTIKTPANNLRLWNIILVQTFSNPKQGEYIGEYIKGWCIPYYVKQ